MERLYVKCPSCDSIFPSGFKAESPIQLIGLLYLCKKCHRIFFVPPSNYLKKVNGEKYQKAMKREEIFSLLPSKGVLIRGPDLFELKTEVEVKSGRRLGSSRGFARAFVVFSGKIHE